MDNITVFNVGDYVSSVQALSSASMFQLDGSNQASAFTFQNIALDFSQSSGTFDYSARVAEM